MQECWINVYQWYIMRKYVTKEEAKPIPGCILLYRIHVKLKPRAQYQQKIKELNKMDWMT